MTDLEHIKIGDWHCNLVTGEISNGKTRNNLTPKSIALLTYFINNHSQVLTKEQIVDQVWQGTIVSDEVLAKTISTLRKAFNDSAKDPQFIETLAKRGYRFKVAPTLIDNPAATTETNSRFFKASLLILVTVFLIATAVFVILKQSDDAPYHNSSALSADLSPDLTSLKKQADDYYFQYTRTDNENAIRLYERIIAAKPSYGPAQSGLATALVQKVLRWPNELGTPDIQHTTLLKAIKEKRLATPEAKQYLERAQALGERAVRLSPNDYSVHRSLGLVYAAQTKFDLALEHYDKAIKLNPNAWGALINKSEIASFQEKPLEALTLLKQAYAAMEKEYATETVKIRPWLPKIGISIAQKSNQVGKAQDAEIWYRKVINYSPLDIEANQGLMQLLESKGDTTAAKEICIKLQISVSPELKCQ